MMRTVAASVVFASLLVGFVATNAAEKSAAPPNFVIILADDKYHSVSEFLPIA